MSELVEHLAELTGSRDRAVLDVALAGAFRDLLHPRSVAVYRIVGDVDNLRWQTRARLDRDDVAATADPAWADIDSLPPLSAHPARWEALMGQTVVQAHDGGGLAVFPLATDLEVEGVLEIATDAVMPPDAQRTVSSILRIYRNFQGLLDYSERDTLTGLLNRKTFDESFMKISSAPPPPPAATQDGRRTAGPGHRWWLGMIDIDHFKTVNDSHGHLIGDEVLLLSRLMRSSFRFSDRLYRFGGEEFVALMRCDQQADARRVFERLRQNMLGYDFPQVGHITVSIGFAEVKPGDSPSTAIERADRAVYYAKAHGRNQVQCHAELVARGAVTAAQKVGDVELF